VVLAAAAGTPAILMSTRMSCALKEWTCL
jgi:hypothetical protein